MQDQDTGDGTPQRLDGGLQFHQLRLGGDRNFQYLLGQDGQAAVVDPGYGAHQIHELAKARGLAIVAILITHGHGDHTGEAAELARLCGGRILAGDPGRLAGAEPLSDGQPIAVGGSTVSALATPGHAPDHFCFLWHDRLLTGDLLFCGKVGGTGAGFPGSSARQEYDSLRRILALPPGTRVYPGHDYYGGPGTMPSSTLGHEAAHNPFLTCADFAAFCRLKDTWAQYKREHGIR